MEDDRNRSEIALLNDKIRSLDEELRFKVSELEAAQDEIRGFRESQTRFEIEISQL